MNNESLLQRIQSIKTLVNPSLSIHIANENIVTDMKKINLCFKHIALSDDDISMVISNVGVNFHYFVIQTDININSAYILRLNYGTLYMLFDEYYDMVDNHTLHKLVQSSTYIENGYIEKECNRNKR